MNGSRGHIARKKGVEIDLAGGGLRFARIAAAH
jgi:hypothetical protein